MKPASINGSQKVDIFFNNDQTAKLSYKCFEISSSIRKFHHLSFIVLDFYDDSFLFYEVFLILCFSIFIKKFTIYNLGLYIDLAMLPSPWFSFL